MNNKTRNKSSNYEKKMQLRISDSMYERMKKIEYDTNINMSTQIRNAYDYYYENVLTKK